MTRQIADRFEREVALPARGASLTGDLTVPAGAKGVVLFAHGSGSSRRSPRNVWVAARLQRAGLATLLFDLLTGAEEQRDVYTREHRFDIPLLAKRLVLATDWIDTQPELQTLSVGYFGASTGAAAALVAAHERKDRVAAVVSRGGRPDLAGADVLASVAAATLLIVGGNDDAVLDLNRGALASMTCEKRLDIVPGATHLFEERGALEQVATLASQWLVEFLVVQAAR
ncbi:MAG TPA: dienelactone hydrolase family protein [Casimicrobiaceae bacterium]|nr:dienelactone hydrolase family protein [Casimicrobiaceae bacterium]